LAGSAERISGYKEKKDNGTEKEKRADNRIVRNISADFDRDYSFQATVLFR
jgi:hypothetical protein